MAINGLHGLLYTSEPDKLRAILRDVFGFKHVDAGGGWLIFEMPPAELGVHPAEGEASDAGHMHLISFMCDDITKTIAELRAKGVKADEPKDQRFGITTMLHLPGGCELMLYEPRHPIAAKIPKKTARKKTVTARRRPQAKKAGRRR